MRIYSLIHILHGKNVAFIDALGNKVNIGDTYYVTASDKEIYYATANDMKYHSDYGIDCYLYRKDAEESFK